VLGAFTSSSVSISGCASAATATTTSQVLYTGKDFGIVDFEESLRAR
jgi:hypothetical protein